MDRMLQNLPALDWANLGRRLRNRLHVIFTRGDLSTLFIACLLLVVPVLALNTSLDITKESIRQSGSWPVSLNQLIPIAILSVVFGFFLARSHFSELVSLLLSAIYCVASILVIQFVVAPGNPVARLIAVFGRFVQAFQSSLHSNTLDPYVLVVFLSVLIWFLGHNTAWHTFRLDRVWRAILPPGIVLILNGFYSQDQSQGNIDLFLIVYVFLSLLLIIRSHVEAREFDWYMNRIAFQGNLSKLRGWFFRSGAVLAVILLIVAWVLPTGSTVDSAKRFQEFLNGDAMAQVTQLLNKLLGSLGGSGAPSVDYYGGDTLTLTGAIKLGDQPVMVVKAPTVLRYYWQSRVFDIYQSNQWSSPRSVTITAPSAGLELKYPPTDPALRQNVDQHFTIAQGSSGLVYGAPQPVKFDVPVQVDTDYVDPVAKTVNPSVTRPVTQLQQGDSYDVTSSISAATADQLRALPRDYPVWVRALDLQLPANITPRTRQLASKIVQEAGATTDYDKAKVVEQWLRANIRYNENIANPPADRELVDWVLFDSREGYCTYYASAMIVMLRSLGIPTRMGAGFAQGVFDPVTQSYIVRESDAHTWVEVYFAQAGWVEFEPTSAQPLLDRSDNNIRPTLPALPTNTPTPTPTPTATPTEAGGVPPVVPQTPPPQPQEATQTMTPTATFTPMPSPTATTPPTQVLEVPPTLRGGFTLFIVLAILISILSFVGVAGIWWVEYRGLDRESPISRAYARVAIYARWLGIPLNDASTPLERGRRVSREVPTGSRPVTTITDMYINERYAPPHDIPPVQEDQAGDAWKRARRAFIIRKIRRFFGRE